MDLTKIAFDAPIPGESLTVEPGSKAWERPPEYENAEDALMHYLNKLQNPKAVDAMADVVSSGMPLKNAITALMMNGAGEGLHTTHVGRIIAPVIHEYLAGTLRNSGVQFEEGISNPDELPPARQLNRPEPVQRKAEAMPMPEVVQETPTPKKKGFMKRPEMEE